MENNTFQEIWEELKKCKKVVMSLHYGPDGDSIGACTAMKYVLEKQLNAEVTLVSPDTLAENMANLSLTKEIEFNKDLSDLDLKNFDAIIFLDSGIYTWVAGRGKENFSLPENQTIINIDHHGTNTLYGTLNYVDEKQPSTCSLLIDFFEENNIEFDKKLSNRLLLGVCTDSGFFTFDTNPNKAIKDASFLIENGADYLNEILKPILYNQPLKLKKYYSLLTNRLKINREKRFAYSYITQEEIKDLNLNMAEVRLGVNDLQFLSEIDFVFTLSEMQDSIKGSFRSKKQVDVSLFAKALGGGGHKFAAAFQLPKTSLEQAEKKVIEAIEKVGIHKIQD
ncbi:MAG: bifunctional oligoribonuclease/PAP phosphatase NrnA [Nanoarchaeota archaeon]|nr:bifunctional oligoribonuclease/PAP phosphatase NrnA [Nanoarchaeota archaeon]MBU1102953.1 bifunctional oligoribonuclease/PAP phosphatase NrnA [Nanoarchaeota archaeon]